MEKKLARLRQMLDESTYTVAFCGNEMIEEDKGAENDALALEYDIEQRYGYSSEEMCSSSFYNTRMAQFFDFYKKEILGHIPVDTPTYPALAAMEQAGKLQCIIDSNIYAKAVRGGCRNVINLYGSIYHNYCPRCKREYPVEYIIEAKRVPLCSECKTPVRPGISLMREMLNSQIMTRTTEEMAKADTLLLLGVAFTSERFRAYHKYFRGRNLVMIHKYPHYTDDKMDMVMLDYPMNILPRLGYES